MVFRSSGGSSLGWALQAVGELGGCVRWADGSGAGEGAAGGAGVGCAISANWVVTDGAKVGRSRQWAGCNDEG